MVFALCSAASLPVGAASAEASRTLYAIALLVKGEPGTLTWHAAKIEGEPGVYRVFDTFTVCLEAKAIAIRCCLHSQLYG